jgi:alpha-beta hydrolase superfamily lysophospholipase
VVWNHGSEHFFTALTKGCALANFLVPQGYIVFVPFRRGQGEDSAGPDPDPGKSTGTYIEDEVASCPPGDTSCTRTQLLTEQADQEVTDAYNYLKGRADVKDDAIAVMGSSYGGRVTVLFNRIDHGQQAVVPFSPAAQAWGDPGSPSEIQTALMNAAADAKSPAFYLQAKWDYDTRPTIDLAYAHHYGGSDPKHGQRFMAAIYEYPKPPDLNPDPNVEELDYDSVHRGFASDTARWGTAVLDFLKRSGVE